MDNTKGRTYFLLILLAGVSVLSFFVLRLFLVTVALSGVFSVILHPLYEKILAQIPGEKSVAAFLAVLVGSLCVVIPLILIGTLVVTQSQNAYASLATGSTSVTVQHISESIGMWAEPHFPGATTYAKSVSIEINKYIAQGLQWLIDNAGNAFASIISIVLHLLIFFMTLFYFLKEGVAIRNALTKQSPIADEEAHEIFTKLSRTITGVVKGSLTIAFIQGTLAGIGFFIFGLPNASLWGVSTAIAALVPGIGTTLVAVPAIIYLFVLGNVGGGIGLLIWWLVLLIFIDNFLAPKLIGRGAGMHPLLILLSVLGGVSFFGPVGIFMGPLTISLLFALYVTYSGNTVPTS